MRMFFLAFALSVFTTQLASADDPTLDDKLSALRTKLTTISVSDATRKACTNLLDAVAKKLIDASYDPDAEKQVREDLASIDAAFAKSPVPDSCTSSSQSAGSGGQPARKPAPGPAQVVFTKVPVP